MTKQYRIVLPLEVCGEFDDDETDMEYIKESLGYLFDHLMECTDYLSDYWKAAQVEEVV